MWCDLLDLNQRPVDYEPTALPTELRSLIFGTGSQTRTGTHKAGDFKSPVSTISPYPRMLMCFI